MYYKSLKGEKVIWGIALVILIICISIMGYYVISGASETQNYNRTAKVIQIAKNCNYHTDKNGNKINNCYPIYFYQVNGKTYNCKSKVVTSKPNGENHYVYYKSNNPSKCMNDTDSKTDSFGIIVLTILIAIFIFTLVEFIFVNKKYKIIKNLPVNNKKFSKNNSAFHEKNDSESKIENNILQSPIPLPATTDEEISYLIEKPKYDTESDNIEENENIIDFNNLQNPHLDTIIAQETIQNENLETDNKIETVIKQNEEFTNNDYLTNQDINYDTVSPNSLPIEIPEPTTPEPQEYNDYLTNQDINYDTILPNSLPMEIPEPTTPEPQEYNDNVENNKEPNDFNMGIASVIENNIANNLAPGIHPLEEINTKKEEPKQKEKMVFDETIEVETLFDDMDEI